MWTINNFRYCKEEMGECLKSSKFSSENNDKIKWCLRLYPKGTDEENKDYISLYLFLISCDKSEVKANIKFSVLNDRKEKTSTIATQETCWFTQGSDWGIKKYIQRDFVLEGANGLLPDNKLTLYCEVRVYDDCKSTSGRTSAIQFKYPECHFFENIGNLFEKQKYSDVVLSVNEEEFVAHKAILASRSSVFSAMFEDDREKNRFELTDMDHDVFAEILHYIYTGEVKNIKNIAQDILVAADRYALDRLKVMCEEHIYSKLSIDTAAEVLIFADKYGADQLKAHVLDFMNIHATEILETSGWKTMISDNPHLLADAYRALVTQNISQKAT